MQEIEDSIKAFSEKTKTDLLIYYARNKNHRINADDVERICQLVSHFQTEGNKKLNILLHTLGGNINAAIGLVEYLQEKYPEKIQSIVFKAAISSGAFIAVSSKDSFMHTKSVLSDFTLDKGQLSGIEFTEAQQRSSLLALGGVCDMTPSKFWHERFVMYTGEHGKPIQKEDLLENTRVQKLSTFTGRTQPLAYIHDMIVKKMKNNSEINKVYGINTALFVSPN